MRQHGGGEAGSGLERRQAQAQAQAQADGAHPASDGSPLASAAQTWLRRGYHLQFADASLVQLGAPVTGLTRRDLANALSVGAFAGILAALGWLAYLHVTRRGRWHEVSLALTPERRVLTHGRFRRIASGG